MFDRSRVDSLVARWEEARDVGVPVAVERLCEGSPELVDPVRDAIRMLHGDSDVPPRARPAPADADEEAPLVPDGYELHERVGIGGMGVVYRGTHLALDREVALKFLRRRYGAGSETAGRFVEEARIAARLQHPGIPAVHEVGTLADGRPYLAMKLVRGRTLAYLLQEEGHGGSKWLGRFEAVCQAVGAAHADGYIHRDLKPGNVMVGAFGEVQVMDWGLAKKLGDAAPDAITGPSTAADETLPTAADSSEADPDRTHPHAEGRSGAEERTQYGQAVGTWLYMPPEQARGELERVDRRADVFSLGAILCELLTGSPPVARSAQLALRVQAGDFTEAYARLDAADEDAGLIDLAKRCLAAEPEDRPKDAREVAAAVARHRADADARLKAAELERAEATVQVAEQRKRRRVMAWAGGALVGVLILGIAGTGVGLVKAREKEKEATVQAGLKETARLEAVAAQQAERERAEGEEMQRKIAAEEAVRAKQFAKLVSGIFYEADPLDFMRSGQTTPERERGRNRTMADYLDVAEKNIADKVELDHFVKSDLLFELGRSNRNLGRFVNAGRLLRMSYDLRTAPAVIADLGKIAECEIELGRLALDTGDYLEADMHFKSAIERQQASHVDPALIEMTQLQRSWALGMIGAPETGRLLKELIAKQEDRFGLKDHRTLLPKAGLIAFLIENHLTDSLSVEDGKNLLIQVKSLPEGQMKDVCAMLINLQMGLMIGRTGSLRLAIAEGFLRQSLGDCEKAFPKGHIFSCLIRFELAQVLKLRDQTPEADAIRRDIQKMTADAGIASHPKMLVFVVSCADRLGEDKKVAEGQAMFDAYSKAVETRKYSPDMADWLKLRIALERARFELYYGNDEIGIQAAYEGAKLLEKGIPYGVTWVEVVTICSIANHLPWGKHRKCSLFFFDAAEEFLIGNKLTATFEYAVLNMNRCRKHWNAGEVAEAAAASKRIVIPAKSAAWDAASVSRMYALLGELAEASGQRDEYRMHCSMMLAIARSFPSDQWKRLHSALLASAGAGAGAVAEGDQSKLASDFLGEARRIELAHPKDITESERVQTAALAATVRLLSPEPEAYKQALQTLVKEFDASKHLHSLANVAIAGGLSKDTENWNPKKSAVALAAGMAKSPTDDLLRRGFAYASLRAGDHAAVTECLSKTRGRLPLDFSLLALAAIQKGDREAAGKLAGEADRAEVESRPNEKQPFAYRGFHWWNRAQYKLRRAEVEQSLHPVK